MACVLRGRSSLHQTSDDKRAQAWAYGTPILRSNRRSRSAQIAGSQGESCYEVREWLLTLNNACNPSVRWYTQSMYHSERDNKCLISPPELRIDTSNVTRCYHTGSQSRGNAASSWQSAMLRQRMPHPRARYAFEQVAKRHAKVRSPIRLFQLAWFLRFG